MRISRDMQYFRPASVREAAEMFANLSSRGTRVMYYGGGTEILTERRYANDIPGAVIDLKGIGDAATPARQDTVVLGAAQTLSAVAEQNLWPLLTACAERIADHTSRCKITLGGNLASSMPYREASLPFMLMPCTAHIAGIAGIEKVPFEQVFHGALQLAPGQFLAALEVPLPSLQEPYAAVKFTRGGWVDYPLISLAAAGRPGHVRAAISGYGSEPVRFPDIDRILSQSAKSAQSRGAEAAEAFGQAPADDDLGSAEYRKFILADAFASVLAQLEEDAQWNH